MPKETPPELARALDVLFVALERAFDAGAIPGTEVSDALHECATVAQQLGVPPEQLLAALKARLVRAADRVAGDARENYLRAITALAIESFFGDHP